MANLGTVCPSNHLWPALFIAHLRPSLSYCLHSCSAESNSSRPHGMKPTRIFCPWRFSGKKTGVGCHFLLQWLFWTQRFNTGALCLLHWLAVSFPLCYLGTLSSLSPEPNFWGIWKRLFCQVMCVCGVCLVVQSCLSLCNPMDSIFPFGAHQAPLSVGFSRQEYWSGLPFPSPVM